MGFALAVHGGAGLIRRDALSEAREVACLESLRVALRAGGAVLSAGGSALDAVTAAVVCLEDDPLFNAGRGAVLHAGGSVELDAAVMDGHRRAGAIAAATRPKNPVRLARVVMETTPHVLLVGSGADRFAAESGVELADDTWFVTEERRVQLAAAQAAGGFSLGLRDPRKDVYGTVGAVACDAAGHVAAATSTGGMVNKRVGRVGDTPILGAGTFAWDNTAAVSGTGHGEPFLRLGVAGRVSALMELAGLTLQAAADRVIHEDLAALDGLGGVIAVDALGNVAMPFRTAGMFRGCLREGEPPLVAIW